MAEDKLVIVLEEKPDKGVTPLADIQALIDAKEYGDRPAKPGKAPVPTALVRSAVRAYATNIQKLQEARALNVTADSSFPGLVAHGLNMAIKFGKFAQEKKGNGKPAAAPDRATKGGNRRTRHTTRSE